MAENIERSVHGFACSESVGNLGAMPSFAEQMHWAHVYSEAPQCLSVHTFPF
ncbi:predicted protein [Plenodomus lingam JN3]|uniref:Predicted protein n=1 Tax=Leptosphaeria maculans (strain JN3 / isolate v23.1.3 / race Av1-4-5-6-7-8) TaxID=985895 RepID=E4ZZX5_LEPMJ|nr:predicted protein [Plenodomus lingam JN3]CBX96835.1 predicted protein [Plenodomus lingam JN3]